MTIRKHWPHGTLSKALAEAHRRWPLATVPELARLVDCDPRHVWIILHRKGIKVPLAKQQRINWTPEMKNAILEGARKGQSVERLADQIGVCPQALVLGALEVIRDLTCSS